jgi:hypothetical protein
VVSSVVGKTRSLVDEVQAIKNIRGVEAQARKKQEQESAMAQLRPEIISKRLRKVCADSPMCRESVDLLERVHIPQLMSEVAAYLISDESDRGVGETRNLADWGDPFSLVGRKLKTIKANLRLSTKEFWPNKESGVNIVVPALPVSDFPLLTIYEEPISPRSSNEVFDGVSIEIRQQRTPKYVAERCSGSGLIYPNKEGEEFWLPKDMRDFAIDVRAGKIDGKQAVSLRSEGGK